MALGMVVQGGQNHFPHTMPYTKKGGSIHFQSLLELSYDSSLCPRAYPMSLLGSLQMFRPKPFITWRQGSSLLGALIFFLQMAHLISWNILTSHTFPFLSEELRTSESMVSNPCHKPNAGEIQLTAKDGTSVLSLTLLRRGKYAKTLNS